MRARRSALLPALTLSVVVGALTAPPASAATIGDLSGDGSAGSPIVITSAADLDTVTAAINGEPATYAGLSYRLGADIDYAGATYPGIATFSGVLDGHGHAISDVVYGNAANSVALVRSLAGGTVRDLTLVDVTAVTLDGAGQAAAIAATAAGGTVTGNTVIGSTVQVAAVGSTVNTQAGGLVAGTTGATRVTDNLLWDVDVTGRKYAGGVAGYPQNGGVVARNLLVDVDVVADSPGAGSIAAMLVAQLAATPAAGGVDTAGNVVLRGSAAGASARTFAAGISTMAGTAANLVSTATTFKTGTVAGATGTPATAEELALPATYGGLGWDLTAGTGAWRWEETLDRPLPAAAAVPTYAITYDLAGGSAAGNPSSYLLGAAVTLVAPTRDGYEFAGWTGTGLSGPTMEVSVPAGATGDRSYTATWATSTPYALTYDLAGGTVTGNPASYTVESPALTLVNPTRAGHEFAGWTGTGLTGPTTTVTIPTGSTGARSYTATWAALPVTIPGVSGHGTTADPFVVSTPAGLDAVTAAINADAATHGGLTYRLGADIDYAGATFPGIATFSGVFDGDGHAISDVVYGDAADTAAFFRTLTGAEVTDVTFADVTAVTATGAGSAAIVAATATDSVVSGVTVLSSSARVAAVGTTVNTGAAGLVVGAFGTSRITDNLVWDTDVTGRKYAAGLVTYPRTGGVVAGNLVVDVDVVAGSAGAGSIAAMLIAQTQTGVDVARNVVLAGSASGAAATKAAGLAAMTSSAPNLVSTATSFASGTVAGQTGTATTPEELGLAAAYTGLGWDLAAGAFRWSEPLRHPVLAASALPTYALSYDLAGGTGAANPASYALGGPALTLVNPTRTGYQFAGWTGTGLSGATLSLTVAPGSTGDRSYVATWTPAEYGVSYDLAGGTLEAGNPASYTVESGAFTLANPTRTGYTFAGWTGTGLSAPTTAVTVAAGSTGDRAYTATWAAPTTFAVSYDLAGGTVAGTNPVGYDIETAAFTLLNPARAGYTFAGWTGTGLTAPTTAVSVPRGSTGPRSYTATWSLVAYGVTYDVAGGEPGEGSRASYTVESPAFALVPPTRTGYAFAGWTGTGLEGPTAAVTVPTGSTGDRAYAATWTPLAYRLSYDLAGGRVARANPASYTIESGFTLVNPTRAGHRFSGWVGTDLRGPTTTVSVAAGSVGARSYVATWAALPVVPATSTLRLAVADRARQRVRLTVGGGTVPSGTVTVTARGRVTIGTGRKARTRTVTRRQTVRIGARTTTVRLRGLKPGTWTLTARYAGDATHRPATAPTVRLRVTKAGK